MNLEILFNSIAKKMIIDFEYIREDIKNKPGLKGQLVENTLRRFLAEYFPKSLDITSGYIIDVDGNESRQLDVIITDASKTPKFLDSDGVRVVPVECVYAVIEIKTEIQQKELDEIFENMLSVRSLEKKAFTPTFIDAEFTWNVYGTDRKIWPVNYYVFAFDSMGLDLLKERIDNFHTSNQLPVWKRIDGICVLNRGVICNVNKEEKIIVLPNENSQLKVFYTQKALVVFYGLLSNLFGAALPIFLALRYVRNIPL